MRRWKINYTRNVSLFTKVKLHKEDEFIHEGQVSVKSNIEVRGNAKSEDFDLPETSVAFSRVVAG